MRPAALVDTGFLLALLDRDDRWHEACVGAFDDVQLPLLTSEAVLTELFHLVGDSFGETSAAWKLIRSGAVVMGTISDTELAAIHELFQRYRDRPMDFADATLVHLAQRESVSTILTIDHSDFETYRIGHKKRFTILPERHTLNRKGSR